MMRVGELGDNHLSGFDHKIWSFTYNVLLKYNCPIMFREYKPDCHKKLDHVIMFFIPHDHERCQDVIKYIQHEWKNEDRSSCNDEDGNYVYGCDIIILKSKGVDYYLDVDECDKLSKKALNYFKGKLEDKKFLKEAGIQLN